MTMQSSQAGAGSNSSNDFWILIARILATAVFIKYGYPKLIDPTAILSYGGTKHFMSIVAGGAPAPIMLGYLIGAVETLGGIAILVGFKTRWVACAFVLYLILITYLSHNFWDMEGAARGMNESHFYKNMAIMAGFILLTIMGPGRISVDRR